MQLEVKIIEWQNHTLENICNVPRKNQIDYIIIKSCEFEGIETSEKEVYNSYLQELKGMQNLQSELELIEHLEKRCA